MSAADGVHAVAYDAVAINVVLPVSGSVSGQDFVVQFPTVAGQTYRVVGSLDLSANSWTTVADNIAGSGATQQVTVGGALSQKQRFFGVVVIP